MSEKALISNVKLAFLQGGQNFVVDVSEELEDDTFYVHFGTYGVCETFVRSKTDKCTMLKGLEKQPIPSKKLNYKVTF